MLIENAVVDMNSTNIYVQKYLPLYFIVWIVIVYIYITLFTNIVTFECMLGHQSLGVCEVSDPYPLHCLRDTWRNSGTGYYLGSFLYCLAARTLNITYGRYPVLSCHYNVL